MRKLLVFNHVSLDGYFIDRKGDMSWAHQQDAEWNAFTAENARGESQLLFGRVTYEMMAGFWPTPHAHALMPDVAARMNALPKVVFSRTLRKATWQNTKLVKGDLVAAVRRLKRAPGPGMALMGSGRIVAQLTQAGLIDEFQVVVNPVILGAGRSMFAGVAGRPRLRLIRTRAFGNGNVLMCYEPVAAG